MCTQNFQVCKNVSSELTVVAIEVKIFDEFIFSSLPVPLINSFGDSSKFVEIPVY